MKKTLIRLISSIRLVLMLVPTFASCGKKESENIGQFFRILGSVEVPKGCVRFDVKMTETVYSCC